MEEAARRLKPWVELVGLVQGPVLPFFSPVAQALVSLGFMGKRG